MIKDLIKFHEAINVIKHKQRRGWDLRGVKGTKDTIASHSFGAALLGWTRAKEAGMNETKIIKLLLMHDLIMCFMPDVTPVDEGFEDKHNMENKVADQLFATVPQTLRSELMSLFYEYQEQTTPEAVFARECDKLDTILQAYYYEKKTGNKMFEEFLQSNKGKFKTVAGKKLYEELFTLRSQGR